MDLAILCGVKTSSSYFSEDWIVTGPAPATVREPFRADSGLASLYRALLDQASEISVVVDRAERVVFASRAVESLLGYSAQTLIGRTWLPLVHADDQPRMRAALASMADAPALTHARLQHADGSWRSFECATQACLDPHQSPVRIITGRDVTALDALRHQLSSVQASHERVAAATADVHDVIADASARLRARLPRATRVVYSLDADVTGVAIGAVALAQVLIHLADNASEAMPRGGVVTIATRNTPRAVVSDAERIDESRSEWLTIDVTDLGAGMTSDVKARMFEPFFTTKPHGKGTGLGLHVVRDLVARAGGRIDVESAPGQGTTVLVHLPLSSTTNTTHT